MERERMLIEHIVEYTIRQKEWQRLNIMLRYWKNTNNSIKDTWIILRQVISKQKVCLHFPETFSVNGEKVSNYVWIHPCLSMLFTHKNIYDVM